MRVISGDLFSSEAQTLVNTVNCVGIMGKGIALEFKKRFPEMFYDYERKVEAGLVRLGRPYIYKAEAHPWIINFPTKDHWRSVSKLSDIVVGLDHIERMIPEWGVSSLAVPPLGCGHGGLEWRIVGPTLYRHLSRLEIPVDLFAPLFTPPEFLDFQYLSGQRQVLMPPTDHVPSRIDPSWLALVEVLVRINREAYHWPVGRTIFQKIAYFATALGLPTNLRFERSSYGPFSSDLKQIQVRLLNNGLLAEQKIGKMFKLAPGPSYYDACSIYRDQMSGWEMIIDIVSDLMLRMTTGQAEIAATAHRAYTDLCQRHHSPTEIQVLNEVMNWKQKRRPPLKPSEVAEAIRSLNVLALINAQTSYELPFDGAA